MLLLLGGIASGKSTLGQAIAARRGTLAIEASQLIKTMFSTTDRRELQRLGMQLVKNEPSKFARMILDTATEEQPLDCLIGLRSAAVLELLLEATDREAVTLGLVARSSVREHRASQLYGYSWSEFREIDSHPIEREARRMARDADCIVRTDRLDLDTTVRIASELLTTQQMG